MHGKIFRKLGRTRLVPKVNEGAGLTFEGVRLTKTKIGRLTSRPAGYDLKTVFG